MAEAPWARWVFATALGVVTLYCLFRLMNSLRLRLRGTGGHTDVHVDLALVLMGSGMAAMFLAAQSVLPAPWWEVLFAADAAWMGVLAIRAHRRGVSSGTVGESPRMQGYLHHLVANLAMLYMFAAPQTATPVTRVQAAALPVEASGHLHGHHVADAPLSEVQSSVGLAFPLVAWLLMLYFVLGAGWSGADLVSRWLRPASTPAETGAAAVRVVCTAPLVVMSELVMALSMAYMLFVML